MNLIDQAHNTLADIEAAGTLKRERALYSPQSSQILTSGTNGGHAVINFCANNYLGLANDSRLIDSAKQALDSHGFGMASVRFICGTQDLHQALEAKTAAYLGMEDCIVFPSCFDANGGIFEQLLDARGRHHIGRAQPCLHHRWCSPVQGATLPLREQ